MNMLLLALISISAICRVSAWPQVKGTPEYVTNLRHFYHDEYSGTYYRTLKASNELESKSKAVFRYFLTSHNNYVKEADEYFAEWKKVFSASGPFDSDALKDLFDNLEHPGDFQTALQMEQLLENRDDSQEARAAFKQAFISPELTKVEQYYLGDDDIMHGVMVSAVREDNKAVFLVMLMD